MAECTNVELRKAREARRLTRWQLGAELGVSDSTIERWERGEAKPTPEDIDLMGEVLKMPTLWHRWMLSNCDSYRKRYRDVPEGELPSAVLRVRLEMADVQQMQAQIERETVDGTLSEGNKLAYLREVDELLTALNGLRMKLDC